MKYLVPTDYSENARIALQYALEMARISQAEVHVLSVLSLPPNTAGTRGSLLVRMQEDSQAKMQAEIEYCSSEGFRIEPYIREGGVVSTILDVCAEIEPDLVIMGTKGATGLESTVLGSVASKTIEKSPVPVLSIPHDCKFEGWKKLTYGTDLQKGGPASALKLIQLSEAFGSQVDIVHIYPVGSEAPLVQLDLLRKEIQESGTTRKVKYHLHKNDDIQEGLMNFLDASDSELLGMVTKKRGLFRKLIDPSLTRRVAMDAEMPLISFQSQV